METGPDGGSVEPRVSFLQSTSAACSVRFCGKESVGGTGPVGSVRRRALESVCVGGCCGYRAAFTVQEKIMEEEEKPQSLCVSGRTPGFWEVLEGSGRFCPPRT